MRMERKRVVLWVLTGNLQFNINKKLYGRKQETDLGVPFYEKGNL